ncbi:hypothetical protein O0I10_010835 [Lichtheimia ornata]|uniref:Uncharacterized protein n=1 Tax=Lichtheimia ornata TaxID=688661 RepID=A0AAD7UVM2_9FUNG|nr:uncharacterized protein O0I10_010835 [Lichtheimia ornata]KAJ8653507.1 hypothetical protein O0I10_010835 [Lichtheimia ornata]
MQQHDGSPYPLSYSSIGQHISAIVDLLSSQVGKGGFEMLDKKVVKVINWPIPQDKEELSRFIGSLQYCRRFLPHFSLLMEPLNMLRRKGVEDVRDQDQQDCLGAKDPYRLVFNYKPVNAATVDSGYPIPKHT